MTLKQWQKKLEDSVKNMKNFSEPLRLGAFDATAKMGERIFDEGKDVDGDRISRPGYATYSTKPIYINPSVLKDINVPGNIGKPVGKPSSKRKTGSRKPTLQKRKGELFAVETKRKTVYLDGGYKELRNKIGRRIDVIDLKLSGELRMDFANVNSEKKPAIPIKKNELEYQIRLDKSINQKKASGAEDKYGEIFSLSEPERELFFDTIQFEFQNRISKSIGK